MVKNTISHQFIQNPDVSKFYQQYRVQRKKKIIHILGMYYGTSDRKKIFYRT